MKIKTKRLILRPWLPDDAEALFEYAKDTRIGPICGWLPHTSVENSREIIEKLLMKDESYAVTLKEKDKVIGSISLMMKKDVRHIDIKDDEGEIGYWLGVPFWGQGLIPEAVRALLERGFEEFNLSVIWCVYFDGNDKSKRVQEKCGFHYHHTLKDVYFPITNDTWTEHICCISKEEWLALKNK